MAKLQWLARVFGLDGTSQDDDDFVSFEHVDGSRMAANEFHQSDSMRLDDAHFAETLPSFSRRPMPLMGSARVAGAPHRAPVAPQRAH
jgi:hypothetical protein